MMRFSSFRRGTKPNGLDYRLENSHQTTPVPSRRIIHISFRGVDSILIHRISNYFFVKLALDRFRQTYRK